MTYIGSRRDRMVGVEVQESMIGKLREQGVEVEVCWLEGADHGAFLTHAEGIREVVGRCWGVEIVPLLPYLLFFFFFFFCFWSFCAVDGGEMGEIAIFEKIWKLGEGSPRNGRNGQKTRKKAGQSER